MVNILDAHSLAWSINSGCVTLIDFIIALKIAIGLVISLRKFYMLILLDVFRYMTSNDINGLLNKNIFR